MKKLKMFFVALAVLFSSLAYSQNIQVKGVVTDGTTGEPVPFAAIQIKGTMSGASADANGEYTISAPSNGTLVFSSVGYLQVEVPVGGKAVQNVSLPLDAQSLQETIVVAYGTTTKSSFTGSASVVKSDEIEKRQVSNVTNALAGVTSGVQVIQSNGQPGETAAIRIRGIGSMYASNAPLYVVDGIPFEGNITSINTQDVESMTVLKDAAASALYGARGANGVILVTTKKGKNGEAVINAEARLGVNTRGIKNYDVLTDPADYLEKVYAALYNGQFYNTGKSASASHIFANENIGKYLGYNIYTVPAGQYLIGSNGKINPNATLGFSDGTYYYTPDNWADETYRNKLRQEYNVSVRGGSEKLSYYLSLGYLNDQGIIDNSDFKRLSTRLNVEYQAKKWLKLGVNANYSNIDSRYPGEQTSSDSNSSMNAFNLANFIAPVYPMFVRDADGNIKTDPRNGTRIYDYGDGYSTPCTRNWMSLSNPVSDLIYNNTQYLTDVLHINAFAKITFFEGFSYTGTVSADVITQRFHDVGNMWYGQSASYGGSVQQVSTRSGAFSHQHLLTFNRTFGKNTIDVLAGVEASKAQSEDVYALGYNMYSPDNWTVSNVIDRINGSGSFETVSRLGIITRASYDWDQKYYVSASYRRDASSKFHPDHRWGNFWSASAAWNMANENWIKSVSWIDLLKIKASFGQQGNDALNNYACYYQDIYKVSGTDGVFSDGNLVYKGNKDLSWEKSNAFNAGVDFGLFNNKLSGTIEYYNRATQDMLYYAPVAPSNGYTSIPMNIGSVENYGVEFELKYSPFQTKDVKWDIMANITTNANKIKALHPDLKGKMIDGSSIYKEGESMYNMYLVKWAGVNSQTGEAEYWAKKDDGSEYRTADWTTAYNSNRCETGDILPKVYGGFGTNLEIHGFDFSINFSYQLGGRMYDNGYASLMGSGKTDDIGQNWHRDINNAWKQPGDITDVPRLDNIDKYANTLSTRFLTSSNYLSLNNITLGYTLPNKLTKKIKIEAIRFYVAGDNLALISVRKGFDPRMSFTAATTASYSAVRTFSGGVKFTF